VANLTGSDIPDPVPAASVIVLRKGATGMEVLLLRRSKKADYLAEAWVFPGGMVEPEDGEDPAALETARAAGCRETLEEAGIRLDPAALVPYSQWCPPPESPKRFLTWFFVAEMSDLDDVTIDGAEITDHVWVRPADGLAARDAGRVTLMPPTWMALHDLCDQPSIDAVLDLARSRTPAYWETHLAFLPREDDPDKVDVVALWEGDAGYDACDATAPGARRRLHMGEAAWFYDLSQDLGSSA
jgi:8-oxo-dGTP pyrophosphatase MutT (NUDIX family)